MTIPGKAALEPPFEQLSQINVSRKAAQRVARDFSHIPDFVRGCLPAIFLPRLQGQHPLIVTTVIQPRAKGPERCVIYSGGRTSKWCVFSAISQSHGRSSVLTRKSSISARSRLSYTRHWAATAIAWTDGHPMAMANQSRLLPGRILSSTVTPALPQHQTTHGEFQYPIEPLPYLANAQRDS